MCIYILQKFRYSKKLTRFHLCFPLSQPSPGAPLFKICFSKLLELVYEYISVYVCNLKCS